METHSLSVEYPIANEEISFRYNGWRYYCIDHDVMRVSENAESIKIKVPEYPPPLINSSYSRYIAIYNDVLYVITCGEPGIGVPYPWILLEYVDISRITETGEIDDSSSGSSFERKFMLVAKPVQRCYFTVNGVALCGDKTYIINKDKLIGWEFQIDDIEYHDPPVVRDLEKEFSHRSILAWLSDEEIAVDISCPAFDVKAVIHVDSEESVADKMLYNVSSVVVNIDLIKFKFSD